MVIVDPRYNSDLSVGSGRCVQPPAEARFENGKFYASLRESQQCNGRYLFKICRNGFQFAISNQPLSRFSNADGKSGKTIFTYVLTVYSYSFSDRDKMRRRRQPRFDLRRKTDRLQERAGGNFAVSA